MPTRLLSAILLLFAALPAAAHAAAQSTCEGDPAAGARLTVELDGVRSRSGDIVVTIYPDRKGRFLAKGGKLARVRTRAEAGTTSVCFRLAPGFYPVAVYHDENADHDFNRTLFSPSEGFGFSNDPPTTFGIPKFEKVRAGVPAGSSILRIRMRYPK